MKRGQITLLVIIGIILLFSVSMLLFLGRTTYNERLQSQAEASVNEFIESNSIAQYVTSCLQRVTTQGVNLLASQGGVIYDTQGGLTPTTNNFQQGAQYYTYQTTEESYNISYSLIPVSQEYCYHYFPQGPFQSSNPLYQDRWKYPVEKLALADFESRFLSTLEPGCQSATAPKDIRKSGYLGYSKFPFLCTPESGAEYENTPTFLNIPLTCPAKYWESASPNYAQENPSVETQLESFVKTNLINCFDVSLYESKGDTVTLDMDKTNVSVFFMEPGGILVGADFPFEIAIEGGTPIIELVHFEQTLDFNFVDLYDFLFDLTTAMARDPFFNFKDEDYLELPSYKPTFDLELIEGSCNECNIPPSSLLYDDVLIVTDVSTQLAGDYVPFQLAFRQRKPVLDYLANPDQNFIYHPVGGEPVEVDFLFYQQELMEFEPRGVDPNYDDINLTVSGWKETTDNLLDLECCASDASCTLNDYSSCSLSTEEYPYLNLNCCRAQYPEGCNKDLIDSLLSQGLPHECFQDEPYVPGILSQNMEQYDGSINYHIESTDLGFHTIRFEVIDEHGFMDYQDVTVIVYDSPIAILEPENIYLDVNNLFASIEDPYWLFANASLASVFSQEQELSQFVYRIPYENFEESFNNSFLELPNESYSIENITPLIFNKTNFFQTRDALQDPTVDNLEIQATLSVRQIIQGETTESPESATDIILSECLPHGFFNPGSSVGEFGPDDALYYYDISIYEENGEPYYAAYTNPDITDEQKFQLPHVCCEPQEIPINQQPGQQLEGGNFAADTVLCYDNPTYQTCYPPFNYQQQTIDIEEFLSTPIIDDDGIVVPFTSDNYLNAFPGTPFPVISPPGVPNPYSAGGAFGDAINDIYFLSQQQFCSGNRGNVCSGKLELNWDLDLTVECADLNDGVVGQFARCYGPGLPANANTNENFTDLDNYGPTSYYFNNAFDRNVGDYSCQSDDATYFYNVSLTCNSYGYRESFEKDMLGVSAANNYHLSSAIANYIGRGYCAGPQLSTVYSTTSITPNSAGPFECFATCGGDSGCSYQSASDCKCETGDPVCDGINANWLYASYSAGFACAGDTACSNTCQNSNVEKQQCYCESTSSLVATSFSYNSFAGYFGDKDPTQWTLVGPSCCTEAGTYAIANQPVTLSATPIAVCFDGNVQSNGRAFDLVEGSGDKQLLSYQGQVHYCVDNNICADESFGVATSASTYGVTQCLVLDGTGGCEYRDTELNAPCCTTFDVACPTNYCDVNTEAFCCAAGSCTNGNDACNSVSPVSSNLCIQTSASDPLIAQINSNTGLGVYIESAVNVGTTIGGRTCSGNGWV